MSNKIARLKQSDLTRYAKGLRAAGYEEFRVEVEPNGKHTIIAGKVEEGRSGPNPDELLK